MFPFNQGAVEADSFGFAALAGDVVVACEAVVDDVEEGFAYAGALLVDAVFAWVGNVVDALVALLLGAVGL